MWLTFGWVEHPIRLLAAHEAPLWLAVMCEGALLTEIVLAPKEQGIMQDTTQFCRGKHLNLMLSKRQYLQLINPPMRYTALVLNIIILLACIQSINNLLHSCLVLWKNEYDIQFTLLFQQRNFVASSSCLGCDLRYDETVSVVGLADTSQWPIGTTRRWVLLDYLIRLSDR